MRLRALAVLGLTLLWSGHVVSADLVAPPEPQQEEKGIWAAIAYSQSDSKYGFFWGADKRQEAKDIAQKHCENAGGELPSGCVHTSPVTRRWRDVPR